MTRPVTVSSLIHLMTQPPNSGLEAQASMARWDFKSVRHIESDVQ